MADQARPSPPRAGGGQDPDSRDDVQAAAAQVGLVLERDHLPGVRAHLALLSAQAQHLMAWALDEQTLPAETYEP